MPARKFSPGQVIAIRRKAHSLAREFRLENLAYNDYKKKMGKLAQEYFITHSHLSKIINHKIYKDLSDDN